MNARRRLPTTRPVGIRPAIPAHAFADVAAGHTAPGACACGRPAPDAYLCPDCLTTIANELARVPDVVTDLNGIRFGQRGVDYTTRATGTGGAKERPLPIAVHAVNARDHLRRTLHHLVVTCVQLDVTNASPYPGIPHRGDLPAMAGWLAWRVDGMATWPHFADAADVLRAAVGRAAHVTMPHVARLVLCACPNADTHACDGVVLTSPGDEHGRCDTCGELVDADATRRALYDRVRDWTMTAAEIATLATYTVPTGGHIEHRDRIHARIRKWAQRGHLTYRVTLTRGARVFAVGEVLDLIDQRRTPPSEDR
ncbi:hypothetical protein [Nocardioides sp.]|uniref:hypothetical protein n=1 Tax=Nocardioides sp. TaxID=35761 RepID=UPI003510EE9F